jgi:hypothetical protein
MTTDEKPIEIEHITSIKKIDTDKQIVWGIVYEPDTVDSQSDFASAEEIEKMAHLFLEEYNQIGLMHEELLGKGARVVESYLAPENFILGDGKVKKGAWIMATHVIDSDIWQRIKKGELTAYSIGGYGRRKSNE